MKTLRIFLNYHYSLAFPELPQRGSAQGVALPVKVLDEQGTILADGIASSRKPAQIELADENQRVFARLTWPSGRTETQELDLSGSGSFDITFSDAGISRNEWSAWAIPRLNKGTQLAKSDRSFNLEIGRYAKVWLRIWRFEGTEWKSTQMAPSMQYKSDAARQIDLSLERYPHLLQIGGSDVPWRFIALPGGGPCRVLLTPNDSNDLRADPLKVVVTSFRTDVETLLEFLARDSIREASTMAGSEAVAYELFEDKFNDPIAAVVGGYFLLRVENWERVPLSWWNYLSSFSWVPDTAILHCIRLLRAGITGEDSRLTALRLFKDCLDRGWPVYEEGLQLLQEAGSLLKHIANAADAPYFSRVDALSLAKTWAGSSLSFYGREPAKPSTVLWVGMPDAPRRRQLASRDWVEQVGQFNSQTVKEEGIPDVSIASRLLTSSEFIKEFSPKTSMQFASSENETFRSERIESDLYAGRRSVGPIQSKRKERARVDTKKGNWMLLGDIGSDNSSG